MILPIRNECRTALNCEIFGAVSELFALSVGQSSDIDLERDRVIESFNSNLGATLLRR